MTFLFRLLIALALIFTAANSAGAIDLGNRDSSSNVQFPLLTIDTLGRDVANADSMHLIVWHWRDAAHTPFLTRRTVSDDSTWQDSVQAFANDTVPYFTDKVADLIRIEADTMYTGLYTGLVKSYFQTKSVGTPFSFEVTRAGVTDANIVKLIRDATSAADLKDLVDAGYDPLTDRVMSDPHAIDGDTTAADQLADAFDTDSSTFGRRLQLRQFESQATGNNTAGFFIRGSGGVAGLSATGGSGGGEGALFTGVGSASGLHAAGGSTGSGMSAAASGAGSGILLTGSTTGSGIRSTGGASGAGLRLARGSNNSTGMGDITLDNNDADSGYYGALTLSNDSLALILSRLAALLTDTSQSLSAADSALISRIDRRMWGVQLGEAGSTDSTTIDQRTVFVDTVQANAINDNAVADGTLDWGGEVDTTGHGSSGGGGGSCTSCGEGIQDLTIVVIDTSGVDAIVPFAGVTIQNSGQTAIISYGSANSSGVFAGSKTNASTAYNGLAGSSGYFFPTYSFTTGSGATHTDTIRGYDIPISAGSSIPSSEQAQLYDWAIATNGDTLFDAKVTITLVGSDEFYTNTVVVPTTSIIVYAGSAGTATGGKWQETVFGTDALSAPGGIQATYNIKIEHAHLTLSGERIEYSGLLVPAGSPIRLRTILENID